MTPDNEKQPAYEECVALRRRMEEEIEASGLEPREWMRSHGLHDAVFVLWSRDPKSPTQLPRRLYDRALAAVQGRPDPRLPNHEQGGEKGQP